jgi:hypothetical protein
MLQVERLTLQSEGSYCPATALHTRQRQGDFMLDSKRPENKSSSNQSTRRDFLKGAAAVTVGALNSPATRSPDTSSLPMVHLGPHLVSRLIVGANPVYGYSHFNRLFDQHMSEWFTDERLVELLLACEKRGINTWQASYNERMADQFPKIRSAGCTIQWICLAASWHLDTRYPGTPEGVVEGTIKCAEIVAKYKPIGIVFHGAATDLLFRAGKLDLIEPFIRKVHELGFLAGVSTHNPVILKALEAKGWKNEFYMASFYYLSRHEEDLKKELGVVPVGETYLPTDPPKMCQVVRQVRKPCLVYKLLAAGRRANSSEQVRHAFEFAYRNIKPIDAAIVGLYPRYSDQVAENTRIVREILA